MIRAALPSADLDDLLAQLIARACTECPCHGGGIALYAENDGDAQLERYYTPDVAPTELPPAALDIIGQAASSRQTVIHTETDNAQIAIPLIDSDRVQGVFYGSRTDSFSPDDARTLTLVLAQAGTVIALARHGVSLRAANEELTTYREISGLLATQESLDHGLNQLCSILAAAAGVEAAALTLWDEQRRRPQRVAVHGVDASAYFSEVNRPSGAPSLTRQIVETGLPYLLNDAQALTEYPTPFIEEFGAQAILATPLQVRGRTIGAAFLLHLTPGRVFQEADQQHIALIADQIALALDNWLLLQHTETQLREMSILHEVATLAVSSLDLEHFLARSLTLARDALGMQKGAILLYDKNANALQVRHRASIGFDLPDREMRFPANDPGSHIALTFMSSTPFFANEPGAIRLNPDFAARAAITNLLCIPLRVQDVPLGVFLAANRPQNPFDRSDADLLMAIGSHVAAALRNAELLHDMRARVRETDALRRMAVITSATMDMDDMLAQAVRETADLLNASAAMLLIPDDTGRTLRVHLPSLVGLSRSLAYPTWPQDGQGELIHVYHTGLPYYSNSGIHDPILDGIEALGLDVKSAISFPLNTRSRTLGVLSVFNRRDSDFEPAHLELTRAIASQVAVSMESARLFAVERARADRMALINQVSQELSAVLDVEVLLRKAAKSMHATLGYQAVNILLADEATNTLTVAASAAARPRLVVPVGEVVSLEGDVLRQAVTLRQSQTQAEILRGSPDFAPYGNAAFLSRLVVPLQSGQHFLGVVDLLSTQVNHFTSIDQMAMQTLAAQIATAIENARLYQQTQRRLLEQRIVHEIGQELTATLEYRALVNAIVQQMTRALDTASCIMVLTDGAPGRLRTAASYNVLDDSYDVQPLSTSLNDSIHYAVDKRQAAVAYAPDDTLAQLAVPMIARDQVLGVVTWLEDRQPRRFSEEDVRLARTLTSQAAIALENAHLFAQAQRQARDQRFLRSVTGHFSRAIVMDDLMPQIVSSAGKAFDTAQAAVALREGESLQIKARSPDSAHRGYYLGKLGGEEDGPHIWRALQEGQTLVIGQEQDYDRLVDGLAQELRAAQPAPGKLHLLAPIMQRRVLTGVIEVVLGDDHHADQHDFELVEGLARQAGIAIENVRLIEALEQRAAELTEASRLKSEFLANISHELRTPMNSIIGFSESILSGIYGDLGEVPTNRIERIRRNGHSLLAIIDDLLDLSKIEAGKLELNTEAVNLHDALKTAVSAIESQINERGLALHLDISDSLPPIRADALRLRQIVNNLLSNAVKFTHQGSITLRAGLEAQGERAYVWCAVIDTGIGIASDDQEIIFDEFRQVDGTTTREYGGTGLGLAITKKLSAMMGGRIAVESAPGQGSTFTFWLPVYPTDTPLSPAMP